MARPGCRIGRSETFRLDCWLTVPPVMVIFPITVKRLSVAPLMLLVNIFHVPEVMVKLPLICGTYAPLVWVPRIAVRVPP